MTGFSVGVPIQQAEFHDIGLFALRVSIGVLFAIHGYPKLLGESRRQEIDLMRRFGVPRAIFNLVAIYEFMGGLLLLLGFLTRIVSMLFAVLMVAIILFNVTKMSQPPTNKRYVNGWDRDTVLLAGSLLLAITGAGTYATDAFVGL